MTEVDIKEGMKIQTITLPETPVIASLEDTDIIAVGTGSSLKHITYGNFKEPFLTGMDNATITTVPADGVTVYNVSTGGTYSNFLDSNGDAISVSHDDLDEGIVQLRKVGDSWQKVIIPIAVDSSADLIQKGDPQDYVDLLAGMTAANGYLDASGNFVSNSNWRTYTNVPNTPDTGEVQWVGKRQITTAITFLAAYDSLGTRTVLISNVTYTVDVETLLIEVPAGTVKFDVCFNNAYSHSLSAVVRATEDGKIVKKIKDLAVTSALNPVSVRGTNLDFDFYTGETIERRTVDLAPMLLPLLGVTPLSKPTPFASFGWDLYKYNNVYSTSYKPSDTDFESETDVTYYFAPDGYDDNDGLSVATPKKTIKDVISALNGSPPANGATFYIIGKPGLRFSTGEIDETAITFPIVIKGINRPVICAEVKGLTITKDATSDMYSATYSLNSPPIDTTYRDDRGNFKRMVLVGSAAEVRTTPGSYFRNSGSVWFQLHDSRAPDENVIMMRYGPMLQVNSDKLFISNVEFWGAYNGIDNTGVINVTGASTSQKQYSINDCIIQLGQECVSINTAENSLAILYNVYCSNSAADNIGYYGYYGATTSITNAFAFEINVQSYGGGYNDDGSNNGTTMHHGWWAIRVNSDYSYNENKNVADISAAKAWMLGCTASHATSATTNINYSFSNGCEVWFDGCIAGGSTTDLESIGTNTFHFKGEVPGDWIITGSPTIDTY